MVDMIIVFLESKVFILCWRAILLLDYEGREFAEYCYFRVSNKILISIFMINVNSMSFHDYLQNTLTPWFVKPESTHKDSQIIPILSQNNPISHTDSYFLKIRSNIVVPSMLSSPRSLILVGFSSLNLESSPAYSYFGYLPWLPYSSKFNHTYYVRRTIETIKLLIVNLSSLYNLIYLGSCFFLNVKDHVLQPYNTTGIILITNFMAYGTRRFNPAFTMALQYTLSLAELT